MTVQIYSNISGAYAIENNKIVDEIVFDKEQIRSIVDNPKKLIEFSKELMEKFSGSKIVDKPNDLILNLLKGRQQTLREAAIISTKYKISKSVTQDQLIIQAAHSAEDLERSANGLVKRLREWYELYNPEYSKKVSDHEKFVEKIQQNTKEDLLLDMEILPEDSMGTELSDDNVKPILALASECEVLYKMRDQQKKYIEEAMKKQLPNVTAICGSQIGSKLLAIAGSLERLALFPASTIQLLGAEKALFRHMTTGARPPKFGVIINHPLITCQRAATKGKAARMLADKISIAAKIDYFKGEFRGDSLLAELEKKLK